MNQPLAKQIFRVVTLSIALLGVSSARAQNLHVSTFARGTDISGTTTAPDSIALGNNSVWVGYANGAEPHGLDGKSSTIVQYNFNGHVLHTYSILGSVDGLKVDPETGLVWALQNQDGNSTLTLINPATQSTIGPFHYSVMSSTRGYDDVVFRFDSVFLSYTNPNAPSDATIQLLQNRPDTSNVSTPLVVSPILTMGATGTNLATKERNQPTSQSDPDSLKLTPNGDLMLSSGDDGQLIFVGHPESPNPSVSFLTLLGPGNAAVSGLDDAVFVTAERGTFYLPETGANRVLKIDAEDLEVGTLYASVGSLNAFVSVSLKTGKVTPRLPNLNGPHGIQFLPNAEDDNSNDNKQE